MRELNTIKKYIIQAEKNLINNKLNEAKILNAKAWQLIEKKGQFENVENLKNKLIRQQNEITVLMIREISNVSR